ncbi:MAG: hypothetical protein HKN16_00315 [Saprospiraceae bacterium]|nr:hypothetical protein [Saprospiraceae bacterium]
MDDTTFHLETDQDLKVELDLTLDDILPRIKKWSEDIYEFEDKEYYKTRWVQVNPVFSEVVLHLFFLDDYQYLSSVDGDIVFKGKWQSLEESNAIILHKLVNNHIKQSELFDLMFLNGDFFVLKKHGNHKSRGKSKYLLMVNEDTMGDLEIEELLGYLEKEGQKDYGKTVMIGVVILVILVFLFLQLT